MKHHLWQPFTQMQEWEANDQLIIERGKGVYLYDTNGKKYIDGVSSLWGSPRRESTV
jgi:adenosylmethionine-8-amino-7-oxononanoate aminotransferase